MRPSSLLVVTLDTTRADRLEPYGYNAGETPHLAALAAAGTVLEQAWAVTPVTLPSHASLFTGLYPPVHGVRHNGIHRLAERRTTLAEILLRQGFRTAAFLSAAVLDRRYGLDQGFEVYDDSLAGGRATDLRMMAERPATATVAAALAWLAGLEDTERFFLWVHLFDAHAPYEPPSPWAERFAGRPYDGEIAALDAALGRLLTQPRVADRPGTVVMVVADHGESLGEHGEVTHGMLAYDATLRIPWMVRAPGSPAGRRLASPASQVDLLPTALDLLGLNSLSEADEPAGRSLGPAIRSGTDPAEAAGRALYAETLVPLYTYGWAELRVVRQGKWKLIEAPEPELYDLAADPGEERNLTALEARRAALLRTELERLEAGRGLPVEEGPLDRQAQARLESLGYVARGGGERSERPDPKRMIDLHIAIERAETLLHRREYAEGVRELEQALRRDPENLSALESLAEGLGGLGHFQEALEAVRKAERLAPGDPDLRLTLATLEWGVGRPEAALAALEDALALDPGHTDAAVQKGLYLAELGRREETVALLERALERDPNHRRLACVYAAAVELPAGETAAAEARVRQAVEAEPFLTEGWTALARVLEQQGRLDEAQAALEQGLSYVPREGDLYARLGLLLARSGSGEAAERHLRDALRFSARPPPAVRIALGDRLRGLGRAEEAREQYAAVLSLPPRGRSERHERAKALLALERAAEAEAEWRLLVEQDPSDAAALANLASLAAVQGDWANAERRARRALELDPSLAAAWNTLAAALEEGGHPEEALAAYERALAAEPTSAEARFNQGLLLRRLGRYAEAAASFAAVVARSPDHAQAHFQLGMLFAGPLADPARAREHLERCLAAAPDHPGAEGVRRLLAALPPASDE